jgi:hypothetical protein
LLAWTKYKGIVLFRTYFSPIGNYVEINTSIDATTIEKAKLNNNSWQAKQN